MNLGKTTWVEWFRVDELPLTQWKNGRGSTREVVSWPRGSDHETFAWRVSVATIKRSSLFSLFPDVERTILVLDGPGIHLRANGVDQRLNTASKPFTFDGSQQISCEPLGSSSTGLNVMGRRGFGTVKTQVVTGPTEVPGHHGLALALRGGWHGGPKHLTAGTGLWWADHQWTRPLTPTADQGLAVLISWTPPP